MRSVGQIQVRYSSAGREVKSGGLNGLERARVHYEHGLLAKDQGALSSEEEILRAALLCFVAIGYHGTTIRQVAVRAGLSVPGLYHHFASKALLLERLIHNTMDDLIEVTVAAMDAAGPEIGARFDAALDAHVRYHCERPEESFIGNSELRSLSPAARRDIVAKRDRQQRIFDRLVEEGQEAGVFDVPWPREASRAIVTMSTAVATWYSRSGPLTPNDIVEIYRGLARQLLGSAPLLIAPAALR